MNDVLINELVDRRQTLGINGKPLSYRKLAKDISDQMNAATLHRFIEGGMTLQVGQLRLLASWAKKNNDTKLLRAITVYTLGIDVLIAVVDN